MHAPSFVDGPAYGTRSTFARLSTGVQIHYVEQGNLLGEPIVFIHGWPDSWFSFSAVMNAAPTANRAFALDMRGFGNSERPASAVTIDQLAADVAAFVDHVGMGAATLVGHSMGSFVARRVAERFPEHVRRLMLIGSSVSVLNDVTREVQEIVHTLSDPIPPSFVREFQGSTIQLPVTARFFERLVSESLKSPARVWRETLDSLVTFDDAADLGRIAVPTLIVWGDRDGVFTSCADQVHLASAIPGSRLTVYAGAGHSPNWEVPARIVGDLTAFLRVTA